MLPCRLSHHFYLSNLYYFCFKATVKVASTENGVIFSTIAYDVRGSTSDRNCVYLDDIHIDIMVILYIN